MKKLFATFLSLLMVFLAKATIHIVSNLPGVTANFINLTDATLAAASGDTIYVQPSPTAYANFQYLDKKIVFLGAGFKPDKDLGLQSIIQGFRAGDQLSVAGSPSGSVFNGLVFTGGVEIAYSFTGSTGINNLTFRRCEFRSGATYSYLNFGSASQSLSNILIESCYFNHSYISLSAFSGSMSNMIVRNCYFRESINSRYFDGFNSVSNILIDHNLFYSSSPRIFSNADTKFLLISNNVFINVNFIATQLTNSTFNNNITFGGTASPWLNDANINGGGNIANQDPQLAGMAAILVNANNPLLDFSILSGPANNSGSDGKDIGLLFDAASSTNWLFARNALLPYIKTLNILNPTLSPGGILNVNIEAKAAQ
jgi:hypothetical protein